MRKIKWKYTVVWWGFEGENSQYNDKTVDKKNQKKTCENAQQQKCELRCCWHNLPTCCEISALTGELMWQQVWTLQLWPVPDKRKIQDSISVNMCVSVNYKYSRWTERRLMKELTESPVWREWGCLCSFFFCRRCSTTSPLFIIICKIKRRRRGRSPHRNYIHYHPPDLSCWLMSLLISTFNVVAKKIPVCLLTPAEATVRCGY